MKPFIAPGPILSLKGEISLLGDKSIAHRALILSALASGKTTIKNFPLNKDSLSTLKALRKLGINIKKKKLEKPLGSSMVMVSGRGLYGLEKPKSSVFVGDSGTTMRLLLGVLAGQSFSATLTAGKSLSQRPMLRVTEPLRLMGAQIRAQEHKRTRAGGEEYPPIRIKGGNLKAITYKMPIASAQVKSAIILAGLYAKGKTRVIQPVLSRDHTERMLKLFKADLKTRQNIVTIEGGRELISPGEINIPADISSAAFFLVLAAIIENSRLIVRNVSLNPSRSGIIRVLKRMGADIKVTRSQGHKVTSFEPMGDIVVKGSSLRGVTVKKEEIPSLIDELPILMVAASYAKGKTVLEGAGELRLKETDRIRSMSENLKKMGADIVISKAAGSENIVIRGVKQLKGARVKAFGDHRTAMSMVIAGLKASGKTTIDDTSCIDKSFPHFLSLLKSIIE